MTIIDNPDDRVRWLGQCSAAMQHVLQLADGVTAAQTAQPTEAQAVQLAQIDAAIGEAVDALRRAARLVRRLPV